MAKNEKILLAHGGGGEEMNELIGGLIFSVFDNEILRANNDSATLCVKSNSVLTNSAKQGANCEEKGASNEVKIAFSTDSFVVSPAEFSGGDIGKIAACGTINDLAMSGAAAKFLSCALILEEGLEVEFLKKILTSLATECAQNGVKVVCGDTKVVPRSACDKVFINTSGIGEFWGEPLSVSRLKSGAKVLLSGDIGRHGAVILAEREGLKSALKSDCASLKAVVGALFEAGLSPLCARDATRGGLSAVLNEWAEASGRDILILEEEIAVQDEVKGVCELFGFEPYELANEGTFVLCVEAAEAEKALEVLQRFNKNARLIGEICQSQESQFLPDFTLAASPSKTPLKKRAAVILKTLYGSQRFLEKPKGELLPRIC